MVWILGPLLLIVQFGCGVAVWFGLPGNWFILVAAGLYAWLMPVSLSGEATALGWPALAGLTLLALLGEFGEFAAGAFGARRAGGSKRGAALALVGSMLGGVAGIFVAVPIPIPLVAPLVGAFLLGGLGAMIGAMLGEIWKGRDCEAGVDVGKSAFWGRMMGTVVKAVFGMGMLLLTLLSFFY